MHTHILIFLVQTYKEPKEENKYDLQSILN